MNNEHENSRSNVEQKLRAVAPLPNSAEPLAVMDCGEFSLLISSKDIVTLMSAQKIIASSAANTCGAIEFEQQAIPIFSFNKAFQLQPNLPSMQMTLVIIQHQSSLFALSCSALEKIEVADLHFYPVPLSMSSRKQPFTEFAIVDKRAAGLSSAAELWRLLALRNAVQVVSNSKAPTMMQGAG